MWRIDMYVLLVEKRAEVKRLRVEVKSRRRLTLGRRA